MKKNFILKSALCLTLAASILTMGACKSTGDNGDTTSASGDEQAAPVYYTDVPGSVKKSETVYVNMDNSGDVKDITVTDWLHTDKGQVKVSDTSSLKNITNVKSNIKPVSENGGITMVNGGRNFGFGDVDRGIAMLHIELGAANEGVHGTWHKHKGDTRFVPEENIMD